MSAPVDAGDLQDNGDDRDNLLWHYTNVHGLLGIVEKKVLWATDAEFLNDSEELHQAVPMMQQTWDDAANLLKHGGPGFDANHFARLVHIFSSKSEVRVKEVSGEPAPFVTCFCGTADKLSQWRGYGGGEAYAVGFNRHALASMARTAGGDLLPALYADPRLVPNVSHWPDQDGQLLLNAIERAQVKHPGFKEEDEHRIIIPGATSMPVCYRPGAQGLTPYVKVRIGESAPAAVMVGPGGDDSRVRVVERLLASNEWGHVPVSRSNIPLR